MQSYYRHSVYMMLLWYFYLLPYLCIIEKILYSRCVRVYVCEKKFAGCEARGNGHVGFVQYVHISHIRLSSLSNLLGGGRGTTTAVHQSFNHCVLTEVVSNLLY